MPELNQGVLTLVVTLLPGFLALRVRDFFVPVKAQETFQKVSEVVAYSLVVYLLASAFLHTNARPAWMRLPGENSHGPGDWGTSQLGEYLRALVIAAVPLGAGVGMVEARDIHYKMARIIRLTDRSGIRDAWQEAFSRNREGWVLVHLADGRRVRGWPVLCSEHSTQPSLFLTSAAWIHEEGASVPIPGPGILITERAEVRYVEFLSR